MNKNTRNIIITVTLLAIIGIGANAFAHGGMGFWGGRSDHHGPGWHHRGGYGMWQDGPFSSTGNGTLDESNEAFFNETEGLRANLFKKERELQNELAKSEPDAAKASQLQKEISKLQAEFDQKRIGHMVEMRKLNPNVDSDYYKRGNFRGNNYHGGGYCWR